MTTKIANKITNRLAFRARFLYIGIPLISTVIFMLIGRQISIAVADDFARRLARQYSIEAAANFQISVNPHFVLMQQVSRSTTIARWLANENDPHLKNLAFEEIMGYVSYSPDTRLMFTVSESLRGYDFHVGLTPENFLPWGTLAGGEISQWFFDTRDAEMPFILNIQRERPELVEDDIVLLVWSNHRVMYQDNFVGVVTVGFDFDAVFNAVFGGYDESFIRGYIIDRNGLVRSDSARAMTLHNMGIPIPAPLPEAADNPILASHINHHLQLMEGGIFRPGLHNYDVIQLDRGIYRYASVAPIIGTDWSVVVLSNHAGIFNRNYFPLLASAIAVLILSVLVGSLLVRGTVLTPLFQLTRSARAAASINNETDLYGLGREDEIGDLARTVQYMRDSLKKAMQEMKRVEVAEASNEAKSRFLARMSHEIRTPISAVLGISEIKLQDVKLSPHLVEAFAKIHNSANTLLGIVNGILDLSKIEAGKMEIIECEYNTASMISDVAHLHLNFVGSKSVKFIMNVDENLPAALVGDALRIVQIMNNLLSNAFKYTESGSVTLSIDWDDGSLAISIRDTGLGMTEEQINQINDMHQEYNRFHERKMPGIIGTGLGLSITYSIVEMMGGKINLESQEGVGTNITVRIPQMRVGRANLGKELALRLQQFEGGTSAADKRFKFTPEPMPYGSVLVVDDVETNLYVAKGLLEFYDLDIETCNSGHKAIEKIKQGKAYDIIFMDQMMPEISGDETIRLMRILGYNRPIIALTANAMIGQAEELMKNGFDGFISKPIQTAHLNAILNKHIRDKQPPDVIEKARAQKTAAKDNDSSAIEEFQNSNSVLEKLRTDFATKHKDIFTELKHALAKGDTASAHRLAHTLKGLAALIQENALANAAKDVEETLKNGSTPPADQFSVLEKEMSHVLESIDAPEAAPLTAGKDFDKEKAAAVFDKLAPLLETGSFETQDLLDELRMIPETAVIIRQIENFDFSIALQNLKTLRGILEI